MVDQNIKKNPPKSFLDYARGARDHFMKIKDNISLFYGFCIFTLPYT